MTKRTVPTAAKSTIPRPNGVSLGVAVKGIRTSRDFSNLMSGLMEDLIQGKITPNVGNAVCNAGGKLLKIVEMTHKYGTPANTTPRNEKQLVLAGD